MDNVAYLLTCLRYIEQNPVRARMVRVPDAYKWSRYAAHAFGRWPEWLIAPNDHLSLLR
jgi:putative transposase